MIKYLLILSMLLGSCAVAFRDNDNSATESNKPLQSEKKLKSQMQADHLSDESLLAYDKRSVQSVDEFINLAHIVTNKARDIEFRKSAEDRCLHYFGPKARVRVNGKEMKPTSYLDQLKKGNLQPLVNTQIIPERSYEKNDDKTYRNKLIIHQSGQPSASVITVLIKINKSFGSESMDIWEVKIDRLELIYE